MSLIDWLWIVPVMLMLLLLKGFFSGSEIALVNADKIRLGHEAKRGRKGARLVLGLFQRPERLLTTTLIGTNVATVSLTTLGTLVMIRLLGKEAGDLYAFLIYTPLFLILGEIVPKAVFQEKADSVAPVVVYPLRFFSWLFAPAVFLFSSFARFAARRVGGGATPASLFVTRQQLRTLMEMAERESGAPVFDRFRIERAVRFPDTTVGETMVPAGEIVAIDREAPTDEAIELVRRTGHFHLPAYEGNVTNVVGTVSLTPWDLLDPGTLGDSVSDRVRSAGYVSPHQTLEEVAPLLRDRPDRMAVVVDEFGSATGIITMEDLAESVVGEIDVGFAFGGAIGRKQRRFERLDDGSFRMNARMSISEANDVLGLDLPSGEFHTVGGMIASKLKRLAHIGDTVVVGGYRFVVEEATERSIKSIRVEEDRLPAPVEGADR